MSDRILVCGGRDFADYPLLERTLSAICLKRGIGPASGAIIHGAARGADSMASKFASENGIQCFGFPAKWAEYGSSAGPIRNKRMLDEGAPSLVVAFPGGRGTRNMVAQARKAGIEVIEVAPPAASGTGSFDKSSGEE